MFERSIYNYRKSISFFFLNIALKLNNYKLCAFIIFLNIRKFSKIKTKKDSKRNILVFSKSGGNEDLIESFHKDKRNNINFFWIPRSFLKKIFLHFFKNSNYKDYHTKLTISDQNQKKKNYDKFLISIFNHMDKFKKIDGFISFNIFYYSEKSLDLICKKLKKKLMILHKESTFTPLEEKNAPLIYKKKNDKTIADAITVYSKKQKEILLKSKIATSKQVFVNGCPRADYAFGLRKTKPEKNIIVFYLIEEQRSKNLATKKTKVNWKNLNNTTLKYLINFAKKNPDLEIFLKGKTGVHKKNDIYRKKMPLNIKFIEGGTGEKYLKLSKVIIAFNSTVIFETIASNRKLIIPNFNNEKNEKKNFLYKIYDKKYYANSEKDFNNKLKYYLKKDYKNTKLSRNEKVILNYYLGNMDGKSGIKVNKFIKKVIN